ncbi:hypothetical protein ACEWY4_027323 [Coilia grayii]|uniref:Myb/SANT-like DNA-binding domain-containing protein n=1 Tax=Coilia grayii TaxID=363190 RepID=A0ABD1IS31_9TELE
MAGMPNFTSQELNVLVDEVEKRRLVLFSKLKNSVTNAEKKEAWQEVADRVNSQKTGAGRSTVPDLTPLEERVLDVLGQEAVEGVPGGIDVCAKHHLGPGSVRHRRHLPFPTHHSPPPCLVSPPPCLSSLTALLRVTNPTWPWHIQGAIPCTPGLPSVQGEPHGDCSVSPICTEDPVAPASGPPVRLQRGPPKV